MPMYDPSHPGEIILEGVLKPLGVSIKQAAEILGMSRQSVSAMVNGRVNLSAEMALRIEKAFGLDADFMLRLQQAYSLAQARMARKEICANVRVFRRAKRRANHKGRRPAGRVPALTSAAP